MRELNINNPSANSHKHLLVGASAAVLAASLAASGTAYAADDADRPVVWIELGGQFETLSRSDEPFSPAYLANLPSTFFSPLDVEKPLIHSVDGIGSLSLEPHGSDWVFTAAVKFGRSTGKRSEHQQTPNAKVPFNRIQPFPTLPPPFNKYIGGFNYYPTNHKFEGANAQRGETHTILDFQVGKDVGLGLFGSQVSSVLSAGVRFAQFTSQSHVSMGAAPDIHYPSAPINSFAGYKQFKYHGYAPTHHHFYSAALDSRRSFHGIGPSVSWQGSIPVIGEPEHSEIEFDWGLNGAVLFGRQKSQGHRQTSTQTDYVDGRFIYYAGAGSDRIGRWPITHTNQVHGTANFKRTRSVVIPNLGGMAGLSFRYSDAKVSLGYRADFFFGAMDGGIDTSKSETLGFHGPFATISVGLGG